MADGILSILHTRPDRTREGKKMSPIPHLVAARLEGVLESITVSTVVYSFVALIAVQFVYQIIYYQFFHPLRHYPGPFWAGVTRLWGAWYYFTCQETQVYWKAVQKYGAFPNLKVET